MAAHFSGFYCCCFIFLPFGKTRKMVEKQSFKFINYAPFNRIDVSCFPRHTSAPGVKQLDSEPFRFCLGSWAFSCFPCKLFSFHMCWKGNVQFSDEFSDDRISYFFKDFLGKEETDRTGLEVFSYAKEQDDIFFYHKTLKKK